MTHRLVILCHLALSPPCSYGLRVFCISFRMGSSVQENNQNRADAALAASEAHCPVLSSLKHPCSSSFQRICQLLSMFFAFSAFMRQGVSPAARSLADGSCLLPMKGLCPAQSGPGFGDIVHRTCQKARLRVSRCFKSTTSRQIQSDRYHEQQHNCHYSQYETGWCSTGSSKFIFTKVLEYLSSVQRHFHKQNRKSQV